MVPILFPNSTKSTTYLREFFVKPSCFRAFVVQHLLFGAGSIFNEEYIFCRLFNQIDT